MPEYKAPGVYVEEVERGPKTIEGVSTSVAGFLGVTERGPENPRLVTSFADYRRLYGGVAEGSNLAHAVKGFFDNGGSRCYIGRVTRWENGATAGAGGHAPEAGTLGIDPGTLDFGWVAEDTTVTRSVVVTNRGDPAAGDPGAADDAVTISGLSVTGDDSFFEVADLPSTNGSREVTLGPGEQYVIDVDFVLEAGETGEKTATLGISHDGDAPTSPFEVTLVGEGISTGDGQLAVSAGELDFGTIVADNRATRTVTLTNLGDPDDGDSDIEVTGIDTTDDAFEVAPRHGAGKEVIEAGESLELEVTAAPGSAGSKSADLELTHDASAPASDTTVPLSAEAVEAVMEAETAGPGPWGERVALTVGDATMYKPGQNELFSLTVRYWRDPDKRAKAAAIYADPARDNDDVPEPAVEQPFDNLSPDPSSDNYYVEEVSHASNLVDLSQPDGEPGRPANGVTWLHHDADSDVADAVDVTHYEGGAMAAEDRTALAAFEQVDEITIVCAPDENEVSGVTNAIVNHCHAMEDRIAVLQAPEQADPPGSLTPPVDSSYAAFYHPWITVIHPETGNEVTVPPGGHVAGIYARSDSEQGVHKAPANEVVQGVSSTPVSISQGDQATLNPKGVNCIRSFRGRGIRLWGARTTSSDPSWKYVNVRRLFLYIEESIDEGTQWVVFEPNDEDLWARVRQTISNFLTSVWEDGALMGTTPDEAFYVKCDRSTMTQNDIDNGRLICEIGVAPVKPAEFVVFRISQWTAGAEGGG